MLSNHSRLIMPAFLGLALALSVGDAARAGFVVNVTESGGDVVATGSGTIDTAGLTFFENGAAGAVLNGVLDTALFGPNSAVDAGVYSGIIGPSSFGTADVNSGANIGNGDIVGIAGAPWLWLPQGYVSGSALNSTDTWSGQTFASLGLTPGTYTWTWGSGAGADSFTMNIGASAVPEPSSLAMLGTGAVGVGVLGALRRGRRGRAT